MQSEFTPIERESFNHKIFEFDAIPLVSVLFYTTLYSKIGSVNFLGNEFSYISTHYPHLTSIQNHNLTDLLVYACKYRVLFLKMAPHISLHVKVVHIENLNEISFSKIEKLNVSIFKKSHHFIQP